MDSTLIWTCKRMENKKCGWVQKQKHYDTAGSQVISVPSTDAAQLRLTSEF
jgi:hypothetical protein